MCMHACHDYALLEKNFQVSVLSHCTDRKGIVKSPTVVFIECQFESENHWVRVLPDHAKKKSFVKEIF